MESSHRQQNVVCFGTRSPCVSLNDEHSDTFGAEQNADEQYVQQLARMEMKSDYQFCLVAKMLINWCVINYTVSSPSHVVGFVICQKSHCIKNTALTSLAPFSRGITPTWFRQNFTISIWGVLPLHRERQAVSVHFKEQWQAVIRHSRVKNPYLACKLNLICLCPHTDS